MAGRPLRPATDHRLGRPLPHQPANRPQAPPEASPKTLSPSAPPADGHMRNYPAFPRATPHLGTDCPRVPHPSATGTTEAAPFDLHALGTPPALILSQDQTLHHICCLRPPPDRNPGMGLGSCFVRSCSRSPTGHQASTPSSAHTPADSIRPVVRLAGLPPPSVWMTWRCGTRSPQLPIFSATNLRIPDCCCVGLESGEPLLLGTRPLP